MKIYTWQLRDNGDPYYFNEEKDFSYLVNEITDLLSISPVKVEGKAYSIANHYYVEGKIKVNLGLKCARCLTDFVEEIEHTFEEVFVYSETDFEDENVNVLENEEIDLDQIVLDELILLIPYKPVCNIDCKGLCPTCGTDLNIQQCNCNNEIIDPRLAVLAKFYDNKS